MATTREIKFRAWDKVDHQNYKELPHLKRMTYYANPFINDDGGMYFESIGQSAIGDHDQDRFEIMQYTGLKDKNGKEIYEGDYILILDKHGNDDQGVLKYNEKEMAFVIDWGENRYARIIHDPEDTIEIIGNKYENN